jgi:AcrR family transcriptional regulator
LLSEAISILTQDGGSALTVRRVAAAAGCSTIGVYTHFEGKAGLVDAVVRDGFEALDAAVAVVDRLDGGLQRLRAGAHAYRDWGLSNPTRFRVMFDAFVPDLALGPAAAARGGDSYAAHRARVAYALERGELVEADLDALAHHIWACVHGHVLLQILRGIDPADGVVRTAYDRDVTWLLDGISASHR